MQAPGVLVRLMLCLVMADGAAHAGEAVDAAAAAIPAEAVASPSLSTQTPASPPRWTASGLAEHGGYRWSLSRGALDLGLRFEPRVPVVAPIDARYESAAPLGATLPSISVGLRSVSTHPAPAESLIARALGSDSSGGEVSKIGIEWKPARSQVFFHRGIGFRLSDDERLVMRLRKGSVGIYMHRTF